MEILVFIGVVVLIVWAVAWHRSSKAKLRYEAHKDALEEARRLCTAYGRFKLSTGVTIFPGILKLPVEYRVPAADALRSMAEHVDTTQVPTGLGVEERIVDLLASMYVLQQCEQRALPPAVLVLARLRAYADVFEQLRAETKKGAVDADTVRDAESALTWFDSDEGLQPTRSKARARLAKARALLPPAAGDHEDEDDDELPDEPWRPPAVRGMSPPTTSTTSSHAR